MTWLPFIIIALHLTNCIGTQLFLQRTKPTKKWTNGTNPKKNCVVKSNELGCGGLDLTKKDDKLKNDDDG